jgi:membrane protease YdiL (CAAX protease family)
MRHGFDGHSSQPAIVLCWKIEDKCLFSRETIPGLDPYPGCTCCGAMRRSATQELRYMSFGKRLMSIFWSGVLAWLILIVGQQMWVALVMTNLKVSPKIPWSAAVMALVLWLMWQYLGGRWWPRGTAEARRRNLRAFPVSSRVFAWALVAGAFSIAALSGLWIVFFQISPTPANALPDLSSYPLLTVIATVLMSSLAAPFSEEAAFRGYAQSILERNFRAPHGDLDIVGDVCRCPPDLRFVLDQAVCLLSVRPRGGSGCTSG